MKYRIAVVVGSLMFASTLGCGAKSEKSGASTPTDDSETSVVEPTTPAAPVPSDAGDSGGLSLKLVSVKKKPTVTYTGDTISDVTPDGNDVTKKADSGYFLYVQMDGRNGTKAPIDLTCSYPIEVTLFDTEEAQYTPIDSLDQIRGNPGCNENVQPGQKFKETFIFLMADGTEPLEFQWASVDPELNSAEPASIDLRTN